jgi:hypothetical protein
VAFLLFFRLIAEIGPARATVITYVNPAVAVTLGVLILGERLTLAMAGAFALILAGSVLAARSGVRREPAGQPGPVPVPASPAPDPAVQPPASRAAPLDSPG